MFVPRKVEVLLAALGMKPATLMDVSNAEYDRNQAEYTRTAGKLGLWTCHFKYGDAGWLINVGQTKESLIELHDAFQSRDECRLGTVMGYPATAVAAYAAGTAVSARFILDLDPEAQSFVQYKVSPENAAAEVDVARRWAHAVEAVSPQIYNEMLQFT
jgi:hypothetical protein